MTITTRAVSCIGYCIGVCCAKYYAIYSVVHEYAAGVLYAVRSSTQQAFGHDDVSLHGWGGWGGLEFCVHMLTCLPASMP